MVEQNKNAFSDESHGEPASGSLAVPAAPVKTYHNGVRMPSGWRPGRVPRPPADTSPEAASSAGPDAAGEEPSRADASSPTEPAPGTPVLYADLSGLVRPAPDSDVGTILSAFASAAAMLKADASADVSAEASAKAEALAKAEAPAEADLSSDLSTVASAEVETSAEAEPADFEPIELRARHDGWTPARQRQFLEELAECGIVKEAAARVGMSPKSAWQLRRRAEGTAFGLAFEAALEDGMRRLHSVAFERAVEGVARPVFYHGEKVGEHRTYDNRLLLALLARAGAPFDSRRTHEVRRHWNGWLEAVERGLDTPPFDLGRAVGNQDHVWLAEDGTWCTDFPPPEGADVFEEGVWGDGEYYRTLTDEEIAIVEAAEAEDRARAEADRDAFFRR